VLYPVRLPADLLLLVGSVVALLALYVASLPRTVLLEDDGLFLMSSATLGVSHPPGYPLHVWLGWLASHVPVGTIAFRVHLSSGVFGALACGVVGWLVLRRTGSRVAAMTVSLALGASEHLWSQAILADVYALNALLCFSLLALCTEAAASPSLPRLLAAATLFGVSLANHWPLALLASPAFALTLACRWRMVADRFPLLAATAFMSAAVPYLWLIWRSQQDPLISFYGPLTSWRDVIFYISRKGYARVDVSVTAGWADKLQFAGYVLRQCLTVLTPIGAALAATGIGRQWREGSRLALLGEVAAFVASGFLLAFWLGFDYDFLRVAVFRPYPLVAYGVIALWMGSGVQWTLAASRARHRVLVPALSTALLAVPTFLVVSNWTVNNRSHDTFADRHARLLLELVEPGGVLFVYADSDTGPVGYLHLVEGLRSDVAVYNLQGLVFSNRLLPALASPKVRTERLHAYLADVRRPVYHMTEDVLPEVYGEEHLGFLRKLVPGRPPGTRQPIFRPEAAAFFRDLMAMPPPPDRWVSLTRNQLLHQYGTFLGLAQATGDAALGTQVDALVALARHDYYSLNGMVEALVQYGQDRPAWTRAEALLVEAEQLRDAHLDRERLGREHYLRGFVAFRLGNLDASQRWFQQSVDVHPSRANASHLALAQLARVRQAQAR
jgi:hypothetical protein